METEELITKVSQIIQRKDGSEVRIVVQDFSLIGLNRSIDVYVHRRESPEHQWKLCSDKPHPDWRNMSVDDYIKHGRSEVLQAVSPGEILKLTGAIGKPISYLSEMFVEDDLRGISVGEQQEQESEEVSGMSL